MTPEQFDEKRQLPPWLKQDFSLPNREIVNIDFLRDSAHCRLALL
jgi:hypothetical protein